MLIHFPANAGVKRKIGVRVRPAANKVAEGAAIQSEFVFISAPSV